MKDALPQQQVLRNESHEHVPSVEEELDEYMMLREVNQIGVKKRGADMECSFPKRNLECDFNCCARERLAWEGGSAPRGECLPVCQREITACCFFLLHDIISKQHNAVAGTNDWYVWRRLTTPPQRLMRGNLLNTASRHQDGYHL